MKFLYCSIFFALLQISNIYAQNAGSNDSISISNHQFKDRTDNIDRNDFGFVSHDMKNETVNVATVNSIFVKDVIGFNLDSADVYRPSLPFTIKGINNPMDDSLVVTKIPFVINGVEYYRLFNISMDRTPEFITLEQIKEKYTPNIKPPYLFMVNDNFLTSDLGSYRFDKDFVYFVRAISSYEFEGMKSYPEFTIIRIYTKTKRNIGMRIR